MFPVHLEEIVYDVGHPMQTCFSADCDITLPFLPTVGLRIAITPHGLEMCGDYIVSDVVWDCISEKCYVFSERPLRDADEVRSAALSMEEVGWKISHWESMDEVTPEVSDDMPPIERVTAELLAALGLSATIHLPRRHLVMHLKSAVNGLFKEVRINGNSHHGESALETLRAMHHDLIPMVRKRIEPFDH